MTYAPDKYEDEDPAAVTIEGALMDGTNKVMKFVTGEELPPARPV